MNIADIKPKGRRELYRLITERLAADQPITVADARQLWLTYVFRGPIDNGQPIRQVWGWDNATYKVHHSIISDKEMTRTAVNWLCINIGRLIVHGYLTTMPLLDLSDLQADAKGGKPKHETR